MAESATALPTDRPAALRAIAAPEAAVPETVGVGVLLMAAIAGVPMAGGTSTAVGGVGGVATVPGPMASTAAPTLDPPAPSVTV